MRKLASLYLFVVLLIVHFADAAPMGSDSSATTVLIRCDDIGMCHAVNMAAKQVLDQGFPVSMSVMFACPWYQEAVDLLKHIFNPNQSYNTIFLFFRLLF